MPTSTNPNETSGKAAETIKQVRFPLNEDIPIGTQLRFTRYSRLASDAELQEKQTAIINLPLPLTIPDTSSLDTGTTELGSLGNLSNPYIQRMSNSVKGLLNGGAEDILTGILNQGDSVYNNAIKNGGANDPEFALRMLALAPKNFDFSRTISRDNASVFGGAVQNPHVTTMFRGVNLKAYHLEWRLSPRSRDESDALKDLVDTIKMRAHPEEILNGYGLDYPDLCYVEFTGKAREYLPKYQRSFITSIVASPDSMNSITLFDSGAPTTINLQLSFIELNIVTREVLKGQQS